MSPPCGFWSFFAPAIPRVIKEDPTAHEFEQQLTELIPSLRAFAIARTRHRQESEDLVPDTIVRALASQRQFQPGTNLRAWLFTIMRNPHIDSARQRKREAVTDMDDDDVRDLRVASATQFDRLVLQELAVVIGGMRTAGARR